MYDFIHTYLSPNTHGGGGGLLEPPLGDDRLPFLTGWRQWAHIWWLLSSNLLTTPGKAIVQFVAKKFEKLAIEDTWSASFLRQKWEKCTFFQFFTIKSYCFVMNLNSTQFQLSFEVYYIFVAQNWKFWIFCLKILTRLTFSTSATSSGQTMNNRKSLME